jgi:hypothetical protein
MRVPSLMQTRSWLCARSKADGERGQNHDRSTWLTYWVKERIHWKGKFSSRWHLLVLPAFQCPPENRYVESQAVRPELAVNRTPNCCAFGFPSLALQCRLLLSVRRHEVSMRATSIVLLVGSLSLGSSWATVQGENCGLPKAPPTAGEIFHAVGTTIVAGRVYPRLSAIPRNYNGCQVLWASTNNGPVSRSVTFFRDGRVVNVVPLPHGIPLCAAGENAAQTGCTPRRHTVQVSYPPGCAARTLAERGLPKDCVASFQAEFKLNDAIVD